MAATHDRLAVAQAGTYRTVEVRLLEHRMDIGGRFPGDFTGVSVVRLAHCQVKADRRAHFVEAQAEVWNPGMAGAPGMRCGVFAQGGTGEFVVLSMWESVSDHEKYVRERFPGLRQRSGAADDLDGIAGDLVDLDPEWTVPAR